MTTLPAAGKKWIQGGLPTVYVSDLDRAVEFYTDVLGGTLLHRAGPHFATIDAGGLSIGLHPSTDASPVPGARGAIEIGFRVAGPLEEAVKDLQARGVTFRGPILDDDPVKIAYFGDPDGNPLYLCEYGGGRKS